MTKMREPDAKPASEEPSEEEQDKKEAIHACMRDLIRAVHAQDPAGAAEAFMNAQEVLDSMPHVEGPHESGSFKDQNVKAAMQQENE